MAYMSGSLRDSHTKVFCFFSSETKALLPATTKQTQKTFTPSMKALTLHRMCKMESLGMLVDEELRDLLRREAYDLKVGLTALAEKLVQVDANAAHAALQARLAAFEAWTILATPVEEEDDH
jgi:hypothetical protein